MVGYHPGPELGEWGSLPSTGPAVRTGQSDSGTWFRDRGHDTGDGDDYYFGQESTLRRYGPSRPPTRTQRGPLVWG